MDRVLSLTLLITAVLGLPPVAEALTAADSGVLYFHLTVVGVMLSIFMWLWRERARGELRLWARWRVKKMLLATCALSLLGAALWGTIGGVAIACHGLQKDGWKLLPTGSILIVLGLVSFEYYSRLLLQTVRQETRYTATGEQLLVIDGEKSDASSMK